MITATNGSGETIYQNQALCWDVENGKRVVKSVVPIIADAKEVNDDVMKFGSEIVEGRLFRGEY